MSQVKSWYGRKKHCCLAHMSILRKNFKAILLVTLLFAYEVCTLFLSLFSMVTGPRRKLAHENIIFRTTSVSLMLP
jgi:hypothetical protein